MLDKDMITERGITIKPLKWDTATEGNGEEYFYAFDTLTGDHVYASDVEEAELVDQDREESILSVLEVTPEYAALSELDRKKTFDEWLDKEGADGKTTRDRINEEVDTEKVMMADDLVKKICQEWVDAGWGDDCFWETWRGCPTDEVMTPNMVLARIEVLEAQRAKAVAALQNIAHGGAYTDMQIARAAYPPKVILGRDGRLLP